MSLQCQTPRPTADTVLAEWPVLLAWHGCSDAEGKQQLQAIYLTWRLSCQSPNVTKHCYHTLELLHVAFTSIKTMMELDQPPNMVSLLVFCEHFMKHMKVYVTPGHTVKTVAKFLWQGYILIFGTPAKLLSDQRTYFESNIINELWELMVIWKVRTLASMLKPMDR